MKKVCHIFDLYHCLFNLIIVIFNFEIKVYNYEIKNNYEKKSSKPEFWQVKILIMTWKADIEMKGLGEIFKKWMWIQ